MLIGIAVALHTMACTNAQESVSSVPSYDALSVLPKKLSVTHSPNPVTPKLGGASGLKYTWTYKTTVSSLDESIRIIEFDSFHWTNGHWVFMNYTGKPFGQKEFADWYSCPGGQMEPGKPYSDPSNWGGSNDGQGGRILWFYVGLDPSGRKVQGSAEIVESPAVKGEKNTLNQP